MRDQILRRGPDIRRRVLLALIVGTPLVVLRFTYDAVNVPKLAFLMVGLTIVAGVRGIELLQGASLEGLKRLLVPAAAVAAPLVIAWLFSPYRGWAAFGHYPRLTGLLPYLVVIVFGVLLADAFAGRASDIGWAVLVSGAVVGAYTVIQVAGLDPFEWSVKGQAKDVVASTLGNSNFTGGFLGMVLPLGVALWISDVRRRRLIAALGLLVLAGWFLARSEGGWVAGVAGLAITAGIVLSSRWGIARIAGACVALAIGAGMVGTLLVAVVNRDAVPIPLTIERRADWWEAAIDMSVQSPLVGRGPGSFALEHPRYRTLKDASLGYDITDDPHSVLLTFSTGAGLLGMAGFLAAVAWTVRRGLRLGSQDVLGAGFFGVFGAYVVQGLISIDTVALRAGLWIAIAGLVVSTLQVEEMKKQAFAGKKKKSARARDSLENPVAVAAVAVVSVFLLWAGVRFLWADKQVRDGQRLLAEGQVVLGERAFDSAIGFRSDIQYRRAYGSSLGSLAFVLEDAGKREEEPARILLERAREAFSYVDDVPHVNSIVDLARLLEKLKELEPGILQDSLDRYQEALRLDPLNKNLAEEAIQVALNSEEYDAVVEIVTSHRRDDGVLSGKLALAYAMLGRDDLAQEAIEAALSENPKQRDALKAREVLSGTD